MGLLLNIIKLANDNIIKKNKPNLIDVIDCLMQLKLKNKSNLNLNLLQYLIEFFYFQKIQRNNNKNKIFIDYSKTIKLLNLFRKYNIDMHNVFYELKENIIHA